MAPSSMTPASALVVMGSGGGFCHCKLLQNYPPKEFDNSVQDPLAGSRGRAGAVEDREGDRRLRADGGTGDRDC